MNRTATILTALITIAFLGAGLGSSVFGALYDINDIDTVLIYDPFSGDSTFLNGTAPEDRTGGIGSTDWTAANNFTTAGAIPLKSDGDKENKRTAYLAFEPTQGNVYMLSATLNTTAGGNAWNALGFGDDDITGFDYEDDSHAHYGYG
jgi:hypothetical protein